MISGTAGSSGFVAAVAPGSNPIYVTETNPNDILLGRGAPTINYVGNVRFRELIKTRKDEYVSSNRHNVKDEISRQIIQEIANRGGRFLQQVTPTPELMENLNVAEGSKIWKIADTEKALEKIKQALRDKDPPASARNATTASNQAAVTGALDSRVTGGNFQSTPMRIDSNIQTTISSQNNPGALPGQQLATTTQQHNNAALLRSGINLPTGSNVGLQHGAESQSLRREEDAAAASAASRSIGNQSLALLLRQQQQLDNERRAYISTVMAQQRRLEDLQRMELIRRQEHERQLLQIYESNNANILAQRQQQQQLQQSQQLPTLQQPTQRFLYQEESLRVAALASYRIQQQLSGQDATTGSIASGLNNNIAQIPGAAGTAAAAALVSGPAFQLQRSSSAPMISSSEEKTDYYHRPPVNSFTRSLSSDADRAIQGYQQQQQQQQRRQELSVIRHTLIRGQAGVGAQQQQQQEGISFGHNDSNVLTTTAIQRSIGSHPSATTSGGDDGRTQTGQQIDHFRNNEGKRSDSSSSDDDDEEEEDGNGNPNNTSSSSSEHALKPPAVKKPKPSFE